MMLAESAIKNSVGVAAVIMNDQGTGSITEFRMPVACKDKETMLAHLLLWKSLLERGIESDKQRGH